LAKYLRRSPGERREETLTYIDWNISIVAAWASDSLNVERNYFPALNVVVAEESREPVVVCRASPFASVVPYSKLNNQRRRFSRGNVVGWRRAFHGVAVPRGHKVHLPG
jgi:hypothetical protein